MPHARNEGVAVKRDEHHLILHFAVGNGNGRFSVNVRYMTPNLASTLSTKTALGAL